MKQVKMNYKNFLLGCMFAGLGAIGSLFPVQVYGQKVLNRSTPQEKYYTNPVRDEYLADPSVVKGKDGYFYVYTTGDRVPIIRSGNLTDWDSVGNAFGQKPTWKKAGGIWAPEVKYVDGKYFMYYAFSTWGDPDPGIGVAIADKPEGPFTDHGKLFLSGEIGVTNSIDPVLWIEKNKKYLIWGSLSNTAQQGIYGVQLSPDGLGYLPATKFKIGAGDIEGSMIYKKAGYYYFFGSKGSCCEGLNSSYHLIVARSKKLEGPYLDQNGKDIRERGNGTVILEGNAAFAGPGHCSEIVQDDHHTEWLLYHAIPVNAASKAGKWKRVLMLDKLVWKNGWPMVADGKPTQTSAAPFFTSGKANY